MDLTEIAGCVIKPTYYDVAGVIELCDVAFTACVTCLSDGSKCTSCLDGYALTLDQLICEPCSTVGTQCKTCTIDYCLVCNVGFKMEHPTLCVLDLPPLPPVPPPAPIVCDAANCSICQPLNLSYCLRCVDQ